MIESSSDPTQNPETKPSHKVGYGNPPLKSRFKPGVSGNPKGRPKGRVNLKTVLQMELNRTITVKEGGRNRRLRKGDAWIIKTINSALSNDPKAGAMLINLLRAYGHLDEQPDNSREAPLTQNDAALMADFLQRHRDSLPGSDESSEPDLTQIGAATPREQQKGKVQ